MKQLLLGFIKHRTPNFIKSVGWSNEKTFQKYYNKPLLESFCDVQE